MELDGEPGALPVFSCASFLPLWRPIVEYRRSDRLHITIVHNRFAKEVKMRSCG
jgi:hypothetical protein